MRKTILVVDDDEGILNSIKAILELEGYKVITQNQNTKKLHFSHIQTLKYFKKFL